MAIRAQLASQVICTQCLQHLYVYEKDGVLLANHGDYPPECPDAGKDFLMPTMALIEAPQPPPVDPAT